jgi:DNA-binding response OmpR family regulator
VLPERKEAAVLFVSAQSADVADLRRIMSSSECALYVCTTWQEGLAFLRTHCVPVVICDAELEATDWRRILSYSADLPSPPCLIVASRLADERLWAEVLNLGGYDVLDTPFDAEEVLRVTALAREHWQGETGQSPLRIGRMLASARY